MALALAAGTALAGPKKGGKGAGKGTAGAKGGAGSGSSAGSGSGSGDSGGGPDIEMDSGGGGGSGAGSGSGGGSGDTGSAGGDIEMDNDTGSGKDLSADLNAIENQPTVVQSGPVKKTPVSWKDIVVVIRKPFLKVRRTELFPFFGTTMNDNMIHHYSAGGELNYYLTDVLAIGVEGQYYQHAFADTYDLVARQARRLPTVNEYLWSAALDFHYVPVYGKFAVLDHKLITWEAFFTAGIGAGESEVVPRDTKYPGFTNLLIQPNVGGSMRFFLAKWLTVNLGVRDYIFIDKFEPTDRSPTMNATASEAQNNAEGKLINNIMFQIGLSFWVPTSFEYTTFR